MTVAFSVSTSVPGGQALLESSPKPTRLGMPYYIFQYNGTDCVYPTKFVIWHNELEWFIKSLAVLSERLDLSRFVKPGFYAVLSSLRSSGGLCWFVVVKDNGHTQIALRRYSDSFGGGEKQKIHTRFFEFSRQGKYPQQVIWPARSAHQGYLKSFADACKVALDAERHRLLEEAERAGCGPLPPLESIFQRLAIAVTIDAKLRRIIAPPGFEASGSIDYIALADDAQSMVLSVCSGAATPEEISNSLAQALDPGAVREFTCWTRRYDPIVVRDAYIFSVVDHQRVVAVRDRSVFANDPLFVSLGSPIPADTSEADDWIRAPQCTPRHFEAAQGRGWIEQTPRTPLGRVPIPTVERTATIRPFVTAPAVLRMQRWKVLQLLDECSSSLCNLPGGISDDLVVHLQLVALLMHDTRELFADEEEPAVDTFVERARARFRSVLSGKQIEPASRAELPRKARPVDE
jgi:hypothetical protein